MHFQRIVDLDSLVIISETTTTIGLQPQNPLFYMHEICVQFVAYDVSEK